MKFLLVLAVVLVAFWFWRNNRQSGRDAARPPAPPAAQRPAIMLACAQCGMHVPDNEAVRGAQGDYCCHEHRRQREPEGG